MKTTYETGILGEETAEKYLKQERAMVCLERRYRTKCGEIDLIMLDGDIVVFVEVKARKTTGPGTGLSAVNTAKQKRILNASLIYLMKMKWTDRIVRYDLVEISKDGILHIPDAFQPYGHFYH
ncbi:MAG: YraN family protein [Clostridia bacterium]|jgi:putative endonuclease|nr:YraN family protein [Clostridia bacterium]